MAPKIRKSASRTPLPVAIDIVSNLHAIKEGRDVVKATEEFVKRVQSDTIPMMRDADPDNNGIKFEYNGEVVAGYVQQNDASEFWDQEKLIEWLRTEGLWDDCSVRVFDQQRFEDLVQRGVIPGKKVAKFKVTGNKPSPFVRFGKPKKDSL